MAGVGAAAVGAIESVRSQLYNRFKDTPAIRDIYERLARTLQRLENNMIHPEATRAAAGETGFLREGEEALPVMTVEEKFQRMQQARKAADAEYELAAKAAGYRKGYFLGTLDRARGLGVPSRGHVVMQAAIAATIGVAGTSMFFGSHHIRKNLAEIKQRLDEKEAGNDQKR